MRTVGEFDVLFACSSAWRRDHELEGQRGRVVHCSDGRVECGAGPVGSSEALHARCCGEDEQQVSVSGMVSHKHAVLESIPSKKPRPQKVRDGGSSREDEGDISKYASVCSRYHRGIDGATDEVPGGVTATASGGMTAGTAGGAADRVPGGETDKAQAIEEPSSPTRALAPPLHHWELTVKFLLYVGPWQAAVAARRREQWAVGGEGGGGGSAQDANLLGMQEVGSASCSEAAGSTASACTSRLSHAAIPPTAEMRRISSSSSSDGGSSTITSTSTPTTSTCSSSTDIRTSSISSSVSSSTTSATTVTTPTSSSSSSSSEGFLGQFLGPHAGVSLRDRRTRLIRQLALGRQGLGRALLRQLYAVPASDSSAKRCSAGDGDVAAAVGADKPVAGDGERTGGGGGVGFAGVDANRGDDATGRCCSSSNSRAQPANGLEGDCVFLQRPGSNSRVSHLADASPRTDGRGIVAHTAALIQGYLVYEHPLWVQLSKAEVGPNGVEGTDEGREEDGERSRPCVQSHSACNGGTNATVGNGDSPQGTREGEEEGRKCEDEVERRGTNQADPSQAASRMSPSTLYGSTTGQCSVSFGHLTPEHWIGWWTRDIADVALRAESRQSRWAILPKEQWLSPVVVLGGRSETLSEEAEAGQANATTNSSMERACATAGGRNATRQEPIQLDGHGSEMARQPLHAGSIEGAIDGKAVRQVSSQAPQSKGSERQGSGSYSTGDSPGGSFEEASFDPTQQRPLRLLTSRQLVAVVAARTADAVERKAPRKLRLLVAELQWEEGLPRFPHGCTRQVCRADVAGDCDACAAASQPNKCHGKDGRRQVNGGLDTVLHDCHGCAPACNGAAGGSVAGGGGKREGRSPVVQSCSNDRDRGGTAGVCGEGGGSPQVVQSVDGEEVCTCRLGSRQRGAWVEVSRGFVVEPSWPDTKELRPVGYSEVMQRPYW